MFFVLLAVVGLTACRNGVGQEESAILISGVENEIEEQDDPVLDVESESEDQDDPISDMADESEDLLVRDWQPVLEEERHQISSADIPIKFYYLYDDNGGFFIYDHRVIYLSEEHFITDLIALTNRYFGHYYQFDLEIVENRLYVTHEWPTTNRGGLSSHQTATGLNTLLLTFSSVPNIDKIVFLNTELGFGKAMFGNDGLTVVEYEIEWIKSRFEVR